MAVTSSLTVKSAAAMAGVLPTLGQILAASLTHDIDSFEPYALRALGRLVGFDGAVWGSGVIVPGVRSTLSITRASIVDRPPSLLTEYADLGGRDPVTARWLSCPDQALAVDVDATYRGRSLAPIGDYLRRHRIRDLLLVGREHRSAAQSTRSRAWITAYRESARPFAQSEVGRLQTLFPLWEQARELCLTRQLERLSRAHPIGRAAVALGDRSGVIHVAEPEFSELTGWARGDCLPLGAEAEAGALFASSGVSLCARECGAWLLLQARRSGSIGTLSDRERQVAEHYAEGLTHKEIAQQLGSSPSTVRTQLQSVYRRLGVHTRTQLQRAIATI
jgi:DNA-binding CsgD family transcriptional regulator